MENLCDSPTFTGYTIAGGYAEYAFARNDFVFPLPPALDDLHAAPLLCAGIIGFRSLRVAGVQPGERVGLFGFGASAHLAKDTEALLDIGANGTNIVVHTDGTPKIVRTIPRGGLPMLLRDSHRFSGRRSEIYTTNDEFKLKIYGA